MKNVHDREAPDVQQDKAAADYNVPAIGRRGRQPPFQFWRTKLIFLAEPRWKRTASHQLSFQSGWQPVSLGEPGREVVTMIVIPTSHLVAIAIAVTVISISITVPVVVIVIAMLVVTVSVAAPLRGKSSAT